jgi:hypothetical protein
MNDLTSLQAALDNIQEQYSALIRQQLPSYQVGVSSINPVHQPSPEATNTSQDPLSNSLKDSLSSQEKLLLALYDEFVNTDDGKQLVAGLSKFARFSQAKIAKIEKQ